MRIVVFCPNLIGDTVMATPTLRALRQSFPSAILHGVVKPHVSPTLDGTTWLDDRILFAPSGDPQQRMWAVVKRLRAERYDCALLLPNSFRAALVAWLAGIPRRIGYARGGRSLLLTDRLRPPLDRRGRYLPTPIVDYYIKLARQLGCHVESTRIELATTAAEERAADGAWARLGLSAHQSVIAHQHTGGIGPPELADRLVRSSRPAAGRDKELLRRRALRTE